MFVPVGCAECGKLFQVDRVQLGQPADCPWCLARVLALPVAPKVAPEPLPLPLPVEVPRVQPRRRRRPQPPVRRLRLVRWIALFVLCLFFAGITFAVQRYRSGGFSSLAMQGFVAPDGSCQATLPGPADAVPEPGTAFTPLQTQFTAFASKSWMTRAKGGLGWIDLDPERAKLVRGEDLLANLRDEFGRWLGEPEIDKEGLVKSGTAEGTEVRYGKGTTRYSARIIAVLDSSKPRVYFIWVGGPHFHPDGELAAKVLASFRVK